MTLVDRRTPGWFPVFLREFGCDVIRRGARLQASSVINIRRRRKQPESELSIWKSEASRERASEGAAGVGKGGGVGGMGEKGELSFFARPSLPRLLSRAARACTFHDFSKWKACFHARAYACSTMLKKIENHDCAFVVSNLYFKLFCTSRSCFMTRNLRDSSPFRVAIDARRKKTHEKASILKRVKEPPARPTHTLA